jgi:hypothetical protein
VAEFGYRGLLLGTICEFFYSSLAFGKLLSQRFINRRKFSCPFNYWSLEFFT